MASSLLGNSPTDRTTPIHWLGWMLLTSVRTVGDAAIFTSTVALGLATRRSRSAILWPIFYEIGCRSMPVILITGGFIGMVLAVQSFDQLAAIGLQSRLGSVVNVSLVKELGPVLAATMLAGRVGSAMAAEIGTMKVTEQIDALQALGANPVMFLVCPRFLACVLLIPALTLLADGIGMLSGWYLSVQVLGISSHLYWFYSDSYITSLDIISGVIKSIFFGGAIALVACHRGFHCSSGAEGVGRAATEAFVCSFILVLAMDFLLGVFFIQLQHLLPSLRSPLL
ncbi:MlaE family ABC transporter permease [Planctopirus hydrillae]|nr:ABC transporter permease [Planctopirus hydrillae]ODA28115.1 ABC transporter permease [Planctopirus hydrillae]